MVSLSIDIDLSELFYHMRTTEKGREHRFVSSQSGVVQLPAGSSWDPFCQSELYAPVWDAWTSPILQRQIGECHWRKTHSNNQGSGGGLSLQSCLEKAEIWMLLSNEITLVRRFSDTGFEYAYGKQDHRKSRYNCRFRSGSRSAGSRKAVCRRAVL